MIGLGMREKLYPAYTYFPEWKEKMEKPDFKFEEPSHSGQSSNLHISSAASLFHSVIKI